MKINNSIIPKDRINRPCIEMNPRYITIHDTGNTNKGANAKMHASFIKNTKKGIKFPFSRYIRVITRW